MAEKSLALIGTASRKKSGEGSTMIRDESLRMLRI